MNRVTEFEPWMAQAMRRAVKLSQRGWPAPNPRVGCVIMQKGQVVGEGYHRYAGGPHAEVEALHQAGPDAAGAGVFVTLEPCNHFGRTPPCSQALISAKVKRVFYALADPNLTASGGAETLRRAGIEAIEGLERDHALQTNWPWLSATRRQRPFIAVKAAMSLDGRIALPSGESQWITNESARAAGRRLRAEYGAVLAGRGTVMADDPLLTARIRGLAHEPVRLVMDPHHKLGGEYRVFNGPSPARRIVINAVDPTDIEAPYADGHFDLHNLMHVLFQSNVRMILVEGGSATISHFLRENLVDRIHLFTGDCVLGEGIPWAAFPGQPLSEIHRWHLAKVHRYGNCAELIYDFTPPVL